MTIKPVARMIIGSTGASYTENHLGTGESLKPGDYPIFPPGTSPTEAWAAYEAWKQVQGKVVIPIEDAEVFLEELKDRNANQLAGGAFDIDADLDMASRLEAAINEAKNKGTRHDHKLP